MIILTDAEWKNKNKISDNSKYSEDAEQLELSYMAGGNAKMV